MVEKEAKGTNIIEVDWSKKVRGRQETNKENVYLSASFNNLFENPAIHQWNNTDLRGNIGS